MGTGISPELRFTTLHGKPSTAKLQGDEIEGLLLGYMYLNFTTFKFKLNKWVISIDKYMVTAWFHKARIIIFVHVFFAQDLKLCSVRLAKVKQNIRNTVRVKVVKVEN